MNYFDAIILGIVEGLTEFLPVSSSGHLAVARAVMGLRADDAAFVFVAVALHVATLGSVLVVYGGRLWQVAVGVFRRSGDAVRYAAFLVIGTIPGAVLGVLFHERFEEAFGSLRFIGAAFIVTGFVLWSTRWSRPRAGGMTPGDALGIGLAQAVAILPGISRSGSTISASLWRGLAPEAAAEFSFLLAVIIIAGSGAFEARKAVSGLAAVGAAPLAASFVVAFASGVWSIRFLVALLKRGRFYAFAPYCWTVGVLTIVYALWRA